MKKKLFTTNDQVDIFKGDKYYWIDGGWEIMDVIADGQVWEPDFDTDIPRFKSKKEAKQYILWNKPLLSLEEITKTLSNSDYMKYNEIPKLIKLATSKLKEE